MMKMLHSRSGRGPHQASSQFSVVSTILLELDSWCLRGRIWLPIHFMMRKRLTPDSPSVVGRRKQEVDSAFRWHTVFPALDDAEAALLRSKAGPMASAAFVAIPSMKGDPHRPPTRSGCSSCADCGSHCLCKRAPAGVAVSSTSLATTAQRAQMQGFWVAVVECQRTWPPVSAGKREDQLGGPATRSWVPTTTLMGDWKSSSTGLPCGEGHSWQFCPLKRDGVAQRSNHKWEVSSASQAKEGRTPS